MLRVCTKMVNRRLQLCVIKPVHWGYTYPQNIHIFVKWAACSIAENVQCSSGEHIITVMRHTVCTASGTCVREVCMCERGRSEWPCGLRHGSRPLVFWEWEFESRRGQVCHVFWVLCVCVCVCVCVLPAGYLRNRPITHPEEFYRVWCVCVWSRNFTEEALAH